jgi:subtilisin family serine protease
VRLLVGAFTGAWLVTAGTVLAVEGNPPPAAIDDQPITVFTGDPAAMAQGGEADKLVQYVRAQGAARVIVGLRIVTRIESTLSDAEVSRQRQAQRGVEDAILGRVFGSLAAADVQRFEFIPYMAVTVDASGLARLLADPQVVSVKKETVFEPALTETIPLIHADKVFAKGVQGSGYVVAVIDSGVSKTSPMLAGKVVSEACYSSNIAAQGISSFCPGGATSSLAVGSATNCPLNVPGCDHGTHVASIAAGNSSVYDGVARNSSIIAIKVATRQGGPGCTRTPCLAIREGDVLLALKRVIALRNTFKIAAVNLSLTTRGTLFASQCDATNNELTVAFKNLRAADIAAIVASGNNSSNNSVGIPACITSAIAVGNTQKNDLIGITSNHSPLVDLMAPGTNVTAGVPPGAPCIQPPGAAAYCAKTGTSMAAPHVAGLLPC